MKTCLVTGGAGFIGSHLCDKLVDEGFRVVCVDNLITGSEQNIAHLKGKEAFLFVKSDVTDQETYEKLLTERYDFIFHLASPASPNATSPLSYLAHPLETLLANSVGTKHLLDLTKKKGARFLFASTSEVYGDPLEHPQKETYWGNVNPNGLRSCYDEGKRFGEALTMVYVRTHAIDARIVRIFNTYGPRMADDGRVVVDFVLKGLKGESFTIYGDGTQTRSFCYVSDLVDGIYKAMLSEKTKGEVFNLGNPQEYSVNELADAVAAALKIEKKIEKSPLPADDPSRRQPDISKAEKILNWRPSVALDEGLQKMIRYFKEHPPITA
ncbi:MAG: SDR family oxidoreductase [Candidatus Chisholmbacteria bacterium]|nr:SDR family oxidoreductase [Candidatus Chisholmbacteria bacterium]